MRKWLGPVVTAAAVTASLVFVAVGTQAVVGAREGSASAAVCLDAQDAQKVLWADPAFNRPGFHHIRLDTRPEKFECEGDWQFVNAVAYNSSNQAVIGFPALFRHADGKWRLVEYGEKFGVATCSKQLQVPVSIQDKAGC